MGLVTARISQCALATVHAHGLLLRTNNCVCLDIPCDGFANFPYK